MDTIKLLTDDQLVVKLKEFGADVGPITTTTRGIFERRLLKCQCPPIASEDGLPKADSSVSTKVTADRSVGVGRDGAGDQAKYQPGEDEKEPDTYYGVQLPLELKDRETCCVFIDKVQALRFMKKYPGSRFKPFPARDGAERFAKRLPDMFNVSSPATPKAQPTQPHPVSPVARQPVSEGSEFRSVKTQDLGKLRKFLEVGDVLSAKHLIWSNPRYLINSGDTPTVLQEGFRYNALHVAAMKNQPKSAQLILDTLQDKEFMRRLYPTEPVESRDNRIQFLMDLYLNTPEKGNCECALHFACKFGHAEVVDVLTSYPQLDKHRKNKYGEAPSEIISTRAKEQSSTVKDKIKEYLGDRYFVPLLRSDDNSSSPHIAAPWSPTVDGEGLTNSPGGMGSPSSTDNGLHASPRNSPVSVKAYAGPMNSIQASRFRKNWLTPPSVSPKERKEIADVRRRDSEKGVERIGRNIARTMRVPWMEYWDFLGAYLDFATEEGLNKLESYLHEQYDALQKQNQLEDELHSVAAQLNRLHLSGGSDEDKPSLNNVFNGGKLVLYMDKEPDFLSRDDAPSKPDGAKSKDIFAEGDVGDKVAENVNEKTANRPSGDVECDNSAGLFSTLNNSTTVESVAAQQNLSYDESLFRDFNMNAENAKQYRPRPASVDSDDESDSVASFHTAMDVDYSDVESLFTPPQSLTPPTREPLPSFFIYGTSPNKIDIDVARALEGVPVNNSKYPRISDWRRRVQAYKPEDTSRWGTPKHIRLAQSQLASTPRLLSTPNRPYTPSAYSSPRFLDGSFSSPGSVSDSDSSFDTSATAVRSNLLASFLSTK